MEELNSLEMLKTVGPMGMLALFLLAMGRVAKALPFLGNKYIPVVVILLGMGIYPFIAESGSIAWDVPHIGLYNALVGAVIGTAAITFYDKLIKKWVEKKDATSSIQENKPS